MENKETDHIPEAGKKASSIEYYKESIDYLFERYIESEVEEDELISRKDSIFKEVERKAKQLQWRADRGGSKIYYKGGEEWNKTMREHRIYKYQTLKDNLK